MTTVIPRCFLDTRILSLELEIAATRQDPDPRFGAWWQAELLMRLGSELNMLITLRERDDARQRAARMKQVIGASKSKARSSRECRV